MTDDWRAELADAVARGLEIEGLDVVRSALAAEAEALRVHPDAPVEPLRPDVPLLGVSPCEAGYLGVLLQTDGRLSVHVARSRSLLINQVGETVQPHVVTEAPGGSGTTGEDRESLRRSGLTVPGWYSGAGFAESELIDACTALVLGVRRRAGD
ncbi:MAG: hydrolase [Marmoricola sp.]|nr:hydrolase [Marmoricola sp.]